jgi:hypothetical protein
VNEQQNNITHKHVFKYDLLHNAIVSKNIQLFSDYSQNFYNINDILAATFDVLLCSAYNCDKQNELIEIFNETINELSDPTEYDFIHSFDDTWC